MCFINKSEVPEQNETTSTTFNCQLEEVLAKKGKSEEIRGVTKHKNSQKKFKLKMFYP